MYFLDCAVKRSSAVALARSVFLWRCWLVWQTRLEPDLTASAGLKAALMPHADELLFSLLMALSFSSSGHLAYSSR